MHKRFTRARLAALTALVVIVATLVAARGDDGAARRITGQTRKTTITLDARAPAPAPAPTSTSTEPGRRFSVTVAGGRVVGGMRRERVALGENVTIDVRSDATETVHLHGYDLEAEVAAGHNGVLRFAADIPGVFEVELEDAGLEILRLEVA